MRNFIRGYWFIESGALPERLELVPDGYPEMFFTLQGAVQIFSEENRWGQFSEAGVIGQVTGRFAFETAAYSKVLYVKLYPWAPRLLFDIPAWHLNNVAIDLASLTRDPLFRALSERVYAAENIAETLALLDAFFLKKLTGQANESPFLQFAVMQIYNTNGMLNIEGLTQRVRASRRHLEKVFKEKVGVSPKQYAQIIRVKKASMYLLDPRFCGNINEIANTLNYYDQSHLLKDFKAVVGQSPSVFLQKQLNFSEKDVLSYLSQWDYS